MGEAGRIEHATVVRNLPPSVPAAIGIDRGPFAPTIEGERNTSVDPWKKDPNRVPPKFAYMVGYAGVRAALERLARAAAASGTPAEVVARACRRPGCCRIQTDLVGFIELVGWARRCHPAGEYPGRPRTLW